MDDELEDKVFYQTYISHMKILSKFAVGVPPLNSTFSYLWKLFRLHLLRPEVLLCGLIIFIFLLYIQAVELWSRGIAGRISSTFSSRNSTVSRLQLLDSQNGLSEKQSYEIKREVSAVYAVQGRRPKMEDR